MAQLMSSSNFKVKSVKVSIVRDPASNRNTRRRNHGNYAAVNL